VLSIALSLQTIHACFAVSIRKWLITTCAKNYFLYSVSTYDVSAFAVLNDYEAKSELLTLQPGNVQRAFVIDVLEDTIVENTEQFGVRVTSTDPQVNIVNGDLRVSITDDDSKYKLRSFTYTINFAIVESVFANEIISIFTHSRVMVIVMF
jgi:hypothetical protein